MGWIDFGVILASPIVSFLTLIFDQTMFLFVCLSRRHCNQCDFIWQFIGLWASFYSLWQQLICPNLLHAQAIFVKVTKSIIFLVKSFLGNSNRHLALFSGHTGQYYDQFKRILDEHHDRSLVSHQKVTNSCQLNHSK